MAVYTSKAQLEKAIAELEINQETDWPLLLEEITSTYKKFKPVNLIKDTISDLVQLPDIKQRLVGAGIGLIAGYLSKKIILGVPKNPISKIIGAALQFGVSALVSDKIEHLPSENIEDNSGDYATNGSL